MERRDIIGIIAGILAVVIMLLFVGMCASAVPDCGPFPS
jgi:hypothetical protein